MSYNAYHPSCMSVIRAYAKFPTFSDQENFDVNAKLLTLILASSMVMAYAYRITSCCAKNCSSSEVEIITQNYIISLIRF